MTQTKHTQGPRDIIRQVMFPMVYKSDRRKHSHRCRCCWEIVEDSDAVIMLRQSHKLTWVLHDRCAHIPHTEGNSWRDAFKCWAIKNLVALGYTEAMLKKHHPEEFEISIRMSLCAAAARAELEEHRAAIAKAEGR